MDIARPDLRKKKQRRRIVIGCIGAVAIALITLGLSRLEPAAPFVENALTDTVKRGELVRQVRGNGTLVPETIVWIPTLNSGRILNILVLPGADVHTNTILLELTNPEIEQAAFDAEWQLKAAEAEMANVRVTLQAQRLNQQASVASAEANCNNAQLDYEVNAELSKDGLVPAITLKQSKVKAAEMKKILEVEEERLKISADSTRAQVAVQEAKVAQLQAQLSLKRRLVDALKIRAGLNGVLQQLGPVDAPLRVGQQLIAGANVARVADPTRLKAEIKIPETQAKDLQNGQRAEIDTRNGIIPGRVTRIDPAAQNGTRTVDVTLEGKLPRGAVPELTVDGTIELERLQDVLYVGRPVNGQSESTVGLFKVTDGRAAIRVPVKLGHGSVSAIEVVDGLKEGDQIILTDMSQWDGHEKVRIK